jgi:hypothetical protein
MREILVVGAAILLLSGCLYEVREIDLSARKSPGAGDHVSYLLVDKADYSADGQMLVRKIDDKNLDLVLDPSVYVVDSGRHTISFSFHDFRNQQNNSDGILVVNLRPGVYYQVIPLRHGDAIRCELAEIAKEKLTAVGKREFKSMTNYLMRGED